MVEPQQPVGTASASGKVVLAVLSLAMFVYVIDTTLMNVSISALVEDLDTNVGAVQGAITVYTLTMAAFMLTGGKLGDIWGSRRAFQIGLVVYGIGTTMTALAPSLLFVLIGWSILEGLGSALIVPAINTLVRANYQDEDRAKAYGTLFGVAAAGAAFGPLIGGWLTATLSWRVAFAGEAVIVLFVLIASRRLADSPPVEPKPRLDGIGVVLSAVGLGLVVLGILSTNQGGWRDPDVLTLIISGLAILGVFAWWVIRGERQSKPVLVHPSIFRHNAVWAGLPVLTSQTFVQGGLLFLVPVFAQLILGFDAFETGLTILPLSIAVLVTSIATPKLGNTIYPRWIIQAGLLVLFAGGWVLRQSLDSADSGSDLALGLTIVGVGIGLIVAQLPNLILSGVEAKEASEASGLSGTAQNLGLALGTAVVGSVILAVMTFSFTNEVDASQVFSAEEKAQIESVFQENSRALANDEVTAAIEAAPGATGDEMRRIFDQATVDGFQGAIAVGGLVALLGFLLAFALPKKKLGAGALESAVRTKAIPKLQLEMEDQAPIPE